MFAFFHFRLKSCFITLYLEFLPTHPGDVNERLNLCLRCGVSNGPLEAGFMVAGRNTDVILCITSYFSENCPCKKECVFTFLYNVLQLYYSLHTDFFEATNSDGELSHHVAVGVNVGKHLLPVIRYSSLGEQFIT